jgi:hypothetical protein
MQKMALGNNYDNNKKEYIPAYYSQYGTGNAEGVDPSALSYSFYNRPLKLSISPLKMNNGDKVAYDHDNAGVVWLSHTKARMFYDQILKVLRGELSNGGVSAGTEGLVRFSDGKELGINNWCLIINKVNEAGEVTAGYAYEFKNKHHYAVENFNPNDSSHKKHTYDKLEVEQLLDVLKSYYESMTGAYAYSVMEGMRFNTNAQNTKMDLVMSKLGVEYKPGMTSRSSYSKSYFDTSENTPSDRGMRAATMDDLD